MSTPQNRNQQLQPAAAAATAAATTPTPTQDQQEYAARLEHERQNSTQLAAKNEALKNSQQFVVEKAADFALQQQQRIAELESQLGSRAPELADSKPISVRHGCPRCATCTTLLQTVSQLESMLQNRDSDCDSLRRSLDDAQRVNSLLLEQIDMLQRGLERVLASRSIPPSFRTNEQQGYGQQYAPPQHPTPSTMDVASTIAAISTGQQQQQQQQPEANVSPGLVHTNPRDNIPGTSLPTHVRMVDPASEATLRSMADAVMSLQNLMVGSSSSSSSSVSASRQNINNNYSSASSAASGGNHSPSPTGVL